MTHSVEQLDFRNPPGINMVYAGLHMEQTSDRLQPITLLPSPEGEPIIAAKAFEDTYFDATEVSWGDRVEGAVRHVIFGRHTSFVDTLTQNEGELVFMVPKEYQDEREAVAASLVSRINSAGWQALGNCAKLPPLGATLDVATSLATPTGTETLASLVASSYGIAKLLPRLREVRNDIRKGSFDLVGDSELSAIHDVLETRGPYHAAAELDGRDRILNTGFTSDRLGPAEQIIAQYQRIPGLIGRLNEAQNAMQLYLGIEKPEFVIAANASWNGRTFI